MAPLQNIEPHRASVGSARIVDDEGRFVYYTYGSADNGQQGNNMGEQVGDEDIVGIGIYGGDDLLFCAWDTYGTTGNYAEFFAILKAMVIAWNRNERRITIRTRSRHAFLCIIDRYDQWFEQYGTGTWYTTKGTVVTHRTMLYNIVEMKSLFDEVQFVPYKRCLHLYAMKVIIERFPRGTDTGGHIADELAKLARREKKLVNIGNSQDGIEQPIYPPPPFAL